MSKSDEIDKKQTATLSNTKVQAKRALYHSHVDTRFPSSDSPVIANFDSDHITIGAGVAIFHLATSRVIICRHSLKNFWFLPKGRRDASEDTSSGAEREGYEESGYRNRLLPLPISHLQPQPYLSTSTNYSPYACEPVWTQLVPQIRSTQYILFWYIAETIPPQVEVSMEILASSKPKAYQSPPRFPINMTLAERIALEPEGYQPIRHTDTAVGADEALYESFLLPIDEAVQKLRGTISADVIRRGWAAICLRREMEDKNDDPSTRIK